MSQESHRSMGYRFFKGEPGTPWRQKNLVIGQMAHVGASDKKTQISPLRPDHFNGMPGVAINLSDLRVPTSEFNRTLLEQAHDILGYHDTRDAKINSAVRFMMSLDRFRSLPGYAKIEDSEVKPRLGLWSETLHDDLRKKTHELMDARARSERVQDLRDIYGTLKCIVEQGDYYVSWQEVIHRKRQIEATIRQEKAVKGRIHANLNLGRVISSRSVI